VRADMTNETLFLLVGLLGILTGMGTGFLFGRWFGRHELLRQLFEAKDQELWIAGHYLSVDLREKTKPHRKEGK
jgi:membrane protein DedA with SNARE-associated domain